ncbi:MAG: HEAT repeat domain-containing protein [Planctomycetota bacterium]
MAEPIQSVAPLDEEPVPQVPGSFLSALPQFFVFPFILVVTLTVAYLGLRALVGSGAGDAAHLLAEVSAAPGEHARWQSLHSLADGLRRGTLTLDEVPSSDLAALYARFRSESPEMRQFLLEVLQWKRAPELTSLALGALADEEGSVRMAALFALAQMEDPAAVPALIQHLASEVSDERWVALGALARIGDAASLEAIAGLLGGADTLMHRNAVLALANAGDPRALPWLPALLDRGSYAQDAALDGPEGGQRDEASRMAAREGVIEQFLVNACRATVTARATDLVPQLQSLRANDSSVKVRSAAINALHDLGAAEETH